MTENTPLLDTFFQECEDLIEALTDGLNEVASGSRDDETVNAVFRAVHSIKGAAGAFGLNEIAAFSHEFEAVLDLVRMNTKDVDDALVRLLMRAGDALADLLDAARTESPIDRVAIETIKAALQAELGEEPDLAPAEGAIIFEPLVISVPSPIDLASPIAHRIKFAPSKAFYSLGHEPLYMLGELGGLGVISVEADLSNLPNSLDELDWEESHLAWSIDLISDATSEQIASVFEFAEGLCALEISPLLEDDPASPPAMTEPETAKRKLEQHGASVGSPSISPFAKRSTKESRATLRVDLARVDRLINAVGELIINQSMIAQHIEQEGFSSADEIHLNLEDYKLLAREIQEGVMAIRAQPVRSLFHRMSRIARDASDATGKLVKLETEGEETEIDKTVVERLADSLTQMIRNAIDHGIEAPADRRASGKSETGLIRLRAQHQSGAVLIEISDDGAGLDRARILETAMAKGLVPADAELSSTEIDNFLFAPGFSTASEVTNISGRGVGMDVVKTAIDGLGGRVSISSVAGEGTTFAISLPLTLAVIDGVIVMVGSQTMVVPIGAIVETVKPSAKDLAIIGLNGPLLLFRGTHVPIIDLAASLGQKPRQTKLTDQVLLVVQTEQFEQCALAVDAISDQRQVVIKSLAGNYGAIPGISAATILGDGKIALIIDPDDIAARFARLEPASVCRESEMQIQRV